MKQLAICLLFALVIVSCRKDDCTIVEEYYPFRQDNLDFFPYKGDETLNFQRTGKTSIVIDTISLKGQGKEVTKNVYTGESQSNPSCPTKYYGDTFILKFLPENQKEDSIKISCTSNNLTDYMHFRLNKTKGLGTFLSRFINDDGSCFLGDTIFTNFNYSHVNLISIDGCSTTPSVNEVEEVYFIDRFYGLVRIETSTETWDLIPF